MDRRKFLDFLGKGTIGLSVSPLLLKGINKTRIQGMHPTDTDQLILSDGLTYEILVKWGDPISRSDTFGFNNDYVAFLPETGNPNRGLLWVNHEYIDSMFVSGFEGGVKSFKQVKTEQYNVGGSVIAIQKSDHGNWVLDFDNPVNKRITAETKIPFNWPEKIVGKKFARGTLANCSGGVTPWGTILTCEENYDVFYGERNSQDEEIVLTDAYVGWRQYFDEPPEHYGWVVEVDPVTGESQKHIALGRCAHESATVKELDDGRIVVYTGDDSINQCLYKFVSDKPGSLLNGTLYVANLMLGQWLPIDHGSHKTLQKLFRDQTDVLIHLRQAARYIGGTALDRPEDIDIDPLSGHVFITLTNNSTTGNYYGSILKIEEEGGDHASTKFKPSRFLIGGEESGFACPDNMAFDQAGNLWFASDISTSYLNKPPYTKFMNNGLFVVPRQGSQAGEVIQVGSAPVGAELTGLYFSPDGDTLFMSVQHPGENSRSLAELSSNWPEGEGKIPKPAVVTVSGDMLRNLRHLG